MNHFVRTLKTKVIKHFAYQYFDNSAYIVEKYKTTDGQYPAYSRITKTPKPATAFIAQ
jgi:hypothetical protein